MKSKLFSLFIGLFFVLLSQAQYTTPNTAVDWTLDDIATANPTTVTVLGSVYTLHEDLTIAETDTVRINTNLTLKMADNLQITVFGTFKVEADNVLITADDQTLPYRGFRFEQNSDIDIQNATIEYGGGLQVITETFTLKNCTLKNNVSGVNTGAVVNLSRGIITIEDNHFLNNRNPAIASAANASVSGNIIGNIIEFNNYFNNNRPQINMGPTRSDVPLRIANNTVTGDRNFTSVGGIAISNLLSAGTILAEIENNIVKDNRYGIAITGKNATVLIKDNTIEDNDTQGDPMLGGSGINLNSTVGGQNITVTGNEIRRNLWGITIQGSSSANPDPSDINLGDDLNNAGENLFDDNKNGGTIYALYNNTPVTVMAKHNCWIEGQNITLAEAESVIFHQVDDATLGEVIFDPVCTTFAPCNDVSNVSSSNITETTATISWTVGANETSWNIEYGEENFVQGSADGITDTINTTPTVSLSGLTAGKTYDIYVQSDCGGTNQGTPIKHTFTTNCADVSAISNSNITETTATISWTAGANETSWNIEYGEENFVQGSADGITDTINTTPTVSLSGLTAGKTYDIYVQSDCGGTNQGTPIKYVFATSEVISRTDFTQNGIKLFPNPISDFVTISSLETIKSVSVYNLIGQEVLQNAEIIPEQIDVRQLSFGTYLLKITLENGNSEMVKIVKN